MFLKILSGKKKNSDEELAARYRQSGDLSMLGELYGRYMEIVFAICFKYLKDEEESKDAVMQLFEKVSEELKKHEVRNFKSWLHQVARNHCLMKLRSARNKFEQQMYSIEDQGSAMENMVPAHLNSKEAVPEEDLVLMEKGLEVLPVEQQVCIKLFYLEKKCYKEIAEETGYDLKKVKSYIQNGKRNLKIFMEKQLKS